MKHHDDAADRGLIVIHTRDQSGALQLMRSCVDHAAGGMSAIGTKRTIQLRQRLSAFGQ